MKQQEINDRDIAQNDFGTSFFVEAGAGAGKTYLLVKRITGQLIRGDFHPSEIVAITFTKAAASELSGRITKELSDIANGNDASEAQKAKEALAAIDQMYVGTIHGFCHKILTEQSYVAGIRPDVSVLEPEEAKVYIEKAFAEWQGRHVPKIKDYEQEHPKGYGYDALYYIKGYYDAICELPEDMDIYMDTSVLSKYKTSNLYETAWQAAIKDVEDKLVEVVRKNVSSCSAIADFSQLPADGFQAKAKNAIEGYRNGNLSGDKFLSELRGALKSGKLVMKKGNFANLEGAFITNLIPVIEKALEFKRVFWHATFMECAMEARDIYRGYGHDMGITNQDLLDMARDVVKDNEQVRRYYASQIRTIYVDEFQDTDSVQAKLVSDIASDPDNPDSLRPGALFVVGDPKQSIYRFRGAQPQVFFEWKDKFNEWADAGEPCRVINMPTNFRSDKAIIDWVNDKYKGIIKDYSDMEPADDWQKADDAASKLGTDKAKKLVRGIYKVGNQSLSKDIDNKDLDASRQNDAEDVVRIIKKLVDDKYLIMDKSGTPREIHYSDFLIISHNHKEMDLYVDKLEAENIPVELYGEVHLNSEEIFENFSKMYSYLASSGDRFARRRALEVFLKQGLSDTDSNEKLNELKTATSQMSGYGALRFLTEHLECLLADPKRDISMPGMLSISRRLEQMVENVLANTKDDRGAIAEAVEKHISKTIEREISLTKDSKAVKFMNLHKSKGLEGNIVIFAKRDMKKIDQTDFKHENVFYAYQRSSLSKYVFLKAYNDKMKEAVADRAESDAEYDRLAYVMATRAVNALIFMEPMMTTDVFSARSKDYALESEQDIMSLFEPEEDDDTGANPSAVSKPAAYQAAPLSDPAEMTDARIAESMPTLIDITPSTFEKTGRADQISDIDEDDDELESEIEEEKSNDENRPIGNIFGTVMHRAFELVVLEWARDRGVVGNEVLQRACIRQAISESAGLISSSDIKVYEEYLKEKVSALIVDKSLMDLLEAAVPGGIHPEYEIRINTILSELQSDELMSTELARKLPSKLWRDYDKETRTKLYDSMPGDTDVFVHGCCDLVVETTDKVYVIDYKSDRKGKTVKVGTFEDKLNTKYEGQLGLYRYSLKKAFPDKEIQTMIYHLYR